MMYVFKLQLDCFPFSQGGEVLVDVDSTGRLALGQELLLGQSSLIDFPALQ